MANGIENHTVSLTKFGYYKLNTLITKYPSSEILSHLDEISLDRAQAVKVLAGNESTEVLPQTWDKVKQYSGSEQNALLAISIIFSHSALIRQFSKSTHASGQGTINRSDFDTKTYTNLASALHELGIATNFRQGAASFEYDWSQVLHQMKIGSLAKEIIENQLKQMGWRPPGVNDHFYRTFYEQSDQYNFPKVFGLTNEQFQEWLEHDQLPTTSTPPMASDLKGFIDSLKSSIGAAGLKIANQLILRFVSSLLTKPFVILTGLSGSGKTKLAQSFAWWICEDETQLCIVPVGADWTNREPLLGYPSALEQGKYIKPDNGALNLIIEANKDMNAHKPYFLILDEMNLSHVERYFADFLSVMESYEGLPLHNPQEDWKDDTPDMITLPSNLFIIGTVNIDETTYMFSPKVLDRASVIEFRISQKEMEEFLAQPASMDLSVLEHAGAGFGAAFVNFAESDTLPVENPELRSTLARLFALLSPLGMEFGYRSAAEIYRFLGMMEKVTQENNLLVKADEILDAAFIQKLLPKVHGSRRKLEPALKALAEICLTSEQGTVDILNAVDINYSDVNIRFPLSLEKIRRMYKRVVQDGFTSYAEA